MQAAWGELVCFNFLDHFEHKYKLKDIRSLFTHCICTKTGALSAHYISLLYPPIRAGTDYCIMHNFDYNNDKTITTKAVTPFDTATDNMNKPQTNI